MIMINNLFSIFDPSSSYLSLNWLILLTPIVLFIKFFKKTHSKLVIILKITINKVNLELKQLTKIEGIKLQEKLITYLFIFIVILNIIALIPINFTPTAHISISFPISLLFWTSIIVWGWVGNFKHMIIHLTPIGTPIALINFIVTIEIIRNLIRPITLSVRLSANMVAGHLLIRLLSNFSILRGNSTFISITAMWALTLLEIVVAIVQAYVITTLLTLYFTETISYDK